LGKVNERGAPLLTVRDVAKTFGGVRAIDGVSFALEEGEIVGLIGPNGSGKTTLLNTISGLYRPERGAIDFRGRDIVGSEPHAIAQLGIARTFQHINLADDLSALDNIAVACFAQEEAGLRRSLLSIGRDPVLDRARATAMSAAELMGVAGVALQPCGSLAYGIRRRVEVARSLAASPRLLLLDEPAAGLNEEEQRDFAGRIRHAAERGVTVLVIEHNLAFLRALVGRMICLDRGRIIAYGTPEEVQKHPQVIEAYLGREEQALPDGEPAPIAFGHAS
jgi:ABC-type branched-subunit amino acid transport system ATPase component